MAEEDRKWQLRNPVVLVLLEKSRCLRQGAPDEVANRYDDDAQPERHPPAPRQQLSSGSHEIGRKTAVARISPACVPLSVKLVKKARRLAGECSRVIELAPACSPEAENP